MALFARNEFHSVELVAVVHSLPTIAQLEALLAEAKAGGAPLTAAVRAEGGTVRVWWDPVKDT